MMRAVADASSAVDAEFVYDVRLAVMHANRLGGAVFDTVDTALAGSFVEPHGADKFIHGRSLLSIK